MSPVLRGLGTSNGARLLDQVPRSAFPLDFDDTAFIRWDEKAGLPRDAIRSQCSTCSRHNEKETGYEKD